MKSESALSYWNGRVLPAGEAQFAADDHGLLYGLGFFETFRTSAGHPHWWAWHRERLLRGCERAGIRPAASMLAWDEPRLRRVMRELLDAQRMEDAVFRYTITAGPSGRDGAYDRPAELLTLRPLPSPAAAEGISLRLLSLPRDSGEWVPRPKSLNFANALLGDRELRRRGRPPEEEGLFLTRDAGLVVEATRHNVAWMANGRIRYPDPDLGPVEGVCLRWLLGQGYAMEPRRAGIEELIQAEAVVVLNSVRGVTPVRELWDAHDRTRLAAWNSAGNPLVGALGRSWRESLSETAKGTTSVHGA